MLNRYPMIIIPIDTIDTNMTSSGGFTARLNIIIDGRDRAVTPIINDIIVPSPTPLEYRASAIGMVPNMSAYIGIPTAVAIRTEKGFFSPSIVVIISLGIQL